MDSWEDDPEFQQTWQQQETKPTQLANEAVKPSQKKTTSMEDDFFASLEPAKPSGAKKDVSKFDAIAAELKRKKMIEQAVQEADLDNARDLFGDASLPRRSTAARERLAQLEDSIDGSMPESKAEFDQLASMIVEKVASFKGNKHFDEFVDDLVNGLLKTCGSANLTRKLGQLSIGPANGKGITVKPAAPKKSVSLSGATSRKKDTGIDFSNYDELSDTYSEYSD